MLIRRIITSILILLLSSGCSIVGDKPKRVYHSQFDPVFFIDGKEMTVVYLADENKETGLIKLKAYIFLGTEIYGEMHKQTHLKNYMFKFKEEVSFFLKRESFKNINKN